MPILTRRLVAACIVTVLAASAGVAARAEAWPARPIRFVVPFGPGGANDVVARAVAEVVSKSLGQPIIIDNRPGGGSALGAEIVARAAPDGYTFLTPAAGVITNPMIKTRIGYRDEDLVPVAILAVSPSIIIVPADSPIRDLKGLIAASKNGNGLNFATAGTGSTPHFVAEMLKLQAGAQLQVVPYKSGAEGMLAVIGKQVDATSEASVVVWQQVKAGKLRAVASTWNQRIAALPDVPTTQELGFPGVFIGHWSGVFAPKGTPEDILDKLNRAVDAAVRSPELQDRLSSQGIAPLGGTREDFRKFLAGERARLSAIVKSAQMKDE